MLNSKKYRNFAVDNRIPLQSMPKTRLATIRYQALDRCFSDRTRYYFIEDLIAAVNRELEANDVPPVSRRTIFNDINDMQYNNGWDFLFEEPARINGKRYYRYENPDYSIWRRDLNEHQLSQLKSMLLMLQQFRGLPQFERIEEMVQQLEEHYHFDLEETKDIIAFDTNNYVDGLQYLSPLFEAIVNKQVLDITYCPFGKTPYTISVHPYFIKQYNGRWFMFGLTTNGVYQNISNMALDRIQNIQSATKQYIPNETYNFEEYFEDIVGVSRTIDDTPIKITLRFTAHRLPYVLSKPIHESQSNHRAEENIVELTLIPNKEFYQRLLSFGGDVEIVAPTEIRQEMAKKAEELYKIYQN